jgi:hypothetical protein
MRYAFLLLPCPLFQVSLSIFLLLHFLFYYVSYVVHSMISCILHKPMQIPVHLMPSVLKITETASPVNLKCCDQIAAI